ncbi:MAG: DNA-protecting protein DprA [Geobacter sp.]|nr:DNA-protecting protein DprA [Geobacter sp.]
MEHYHWFALKSVPNVGNVTFRRLLERFGSPRAVFAASRTELNSVHGVGEVAAESIKTFDCRQAVARECAAVERHRVEIVTWLDPRYPRLLREIPDPPPFLYVKGSLAEDEVAVAVVGSRRASTYGRMTTERLSKELAGCGITIVSGMARGIDTTAHKGALAGGGRTLGVLGCGIDLVYPPENRPLFEQVIANGALISEFPMGTLPLAENFPRRNRIISGLSNGVLVVEAALQSGSLITAQMALEQGRDVFAVPGNIDSGASQGTNQLIKQGAKLISSVQDILDELPGCATPIPVTPPERRFDLSPDEEKVHRQLAATPLHIDEITAKSALTAGDVSAILLRLELKGAVQQLPGKYFIIS